jgi:hypothetical protein
VKCNEPDNPIQPYRCSECGAGGCKLWRESYVTLDQVELKCARCTGKHEDRDVSTLDADGKVEISYTPNQTYKQRTDQIGNWLPAVPTGDGSFWGYTSVPPEGCLWWRLLPSLPLEEPS